MTKQQTVLKKYIENKRLSNTTSKKNQNKMNSGALEGSVFTGVSSKGNCQCKNNTLTGHIKWLSSYIIHMSKTTGATSVAGPILYSGTPWLFKMQLSVVYISWVWIFLWYRPLFLSDWKEANDTKRDIPTFKSKINRQRRGKKKKKTSRQTTVYKTQYRQPKTEQHEPIKHFR